MTSSSKRPGRPPGTSDTRDRILTSARKLFASNGISHTSIRAVAQQAGVDAALVHHYFGTKAQLFTAAIEVPLDPMTIIGPLRTAPVDELGNTLLTLLLPVWDSAMGAGMIATLRSVIAGSEVNLMRSFLREIVVVELAARVDNPPGTGVLRAEFAATQILGIVMARHILQLEPFASLPAQQITETIAPNLQRYLTGELPAALQP
ncbi:MAG: TetR family transcriptional regulator [Mycobacteriaceae bacterium]|nr:TetR family transcriptional regulator [Mycobacteriaceae bacterium]